jgi:hypothetical protein
MFTRTALVSFASLWLAGTAVAAEGLTPPRGADVWPQWQARITVSTATLAPVTLTPLGGDGAAAARSTLQAGALLSDFYIDAPGLRLPSSIGGLRATGGLMIGARGMALGTSPAPLVGGRFGLTVQNGASPSAGDPNADTVPYIGVGYTGLAAKGGWGVTADLGLVAENPGGAVRMGRAVFGNSGWDSALREMRISPVLQLGVNYAF